MGFTPGPHGSGTNFDYIGTTPLDKIVDVPVEVLKTLEGHFNYGARTMTGEVIAYLTERLGNPDREKAQAMLYGTQ